MPTLTALRRLDGRFHFLSERGRWFWTVAVLGAVMRVALALFSDGTLDVTVWQGHAEEIDARGLMAYYAGGKYTFNHPPLMGWLAVSGLHVSDATGLPFPFLLRLPFAALDGVTAWLLIALAAQAARPGIRRARYVIGALYWLCPLAIIYSSQHGNTDGAVACFLLASALCVVRDRPAWAGAMIGLGLWIKIPGILAAPALAMALPSWAARARFSVAAAGVGVLTYIPALALDARTLIDSVFLYSGLRIQTTTGTQIWGTQVFYPAVTSLPPTLRASYRAIVAAVYEYNTLICLVPIAVLAWSRQRARAAEEIARTLAGSYALLYGLSNFWAFQYFAWSLPFWFLCAPRVATLTIGVASLYVYGLYAWLCGSLLLLGPWDFIAKPEWPAWLLGLRNASILTALVSGVVFLAASLRASSRSSASAIGRPDSTCESEA